MPLSVCLSLSYLLQTPFFFHQSSWLCRFKHFPGVRMSSILSSMPWGFLCHTACWCFSRRNLGHGLVEAYVSWWLCMVLPLQHTARGTRMSNTISQGCHKYYTIYRHDVLLLKICIFLSMISFKAVRSFCIIMSTWPCAASLHPGYLDEKDGFIILSNFKAQTHLTGLPHTSGVEGSIFVFVHICKKN